MQFSPPPPPSWTVSSALVAASALILFLLGLFHLVFTFRGSKLHPRDPDLQQRMAQDCLRLTSQTSVWRAWIGFNASHSLGILLFGSVYGYLAVCSPGILFQSPFLLLLGFLTLCAYAFLSWRYWFSIPLRGSLLALLFYVLALVVGT
ncbi:MAG: hypothetical protein HY823_04690 [Acidobacteria bacterium]|nr:hypothetical protein [Acidobacteriota bacterium]